MQGNLYLYLSSQLLLAELSLSLQGTSLVCYCVNMFVCTPHARAHICVNIRYALVVSYFSMLCVCVCTLMFEAHMQETVKKSLKLFFPFTPLNYGKPLESHTAVWSSPCTEGAGHALYQSVMSSSPHLFFFLVRHTGEREAEQIMTETQINKSSETLCGSFFLYHEHSKSARWF